MTVGERIRMLRDEKQMTLEEVAEKIGVSKATIYKYETGAIQNIPYDRIGEIAELFCVSRSFVMGWTQDRAVNLRDHPEKIIGVLVPDNEKFIEAYKAMSYEDRVTLMEIFTRAQKRIKEQKNVPELPEIFGYM